MDKMKQTREKMRKYFIMMIDDEDILVVVYI